MSLNGWRMKMNKKGYTVVELLIVIAVFTIIYFVGVANVSYAFSDNVKINYENRLNLIKKQAEVYAKDKSQELFKDNDNITIYAKDLVKNGYFAGNANGDIEDPRDEAKTLNDLKIEITKSGDTYTVNI